MTWWGASTKVRFQVSAAGRPVAVTRSPHRVDLTLDQTSYKPGAIAKVSVDSPFPGQLLHAGDRPWWSGARASPSPAKKKTSRFLCLCECLEEPSLPPRSSVLWIRSHRNGSPTAPTGSSAWQPILRSVRLSSIFNFPGDKTGAEVVVKVGSNLSEGDALVHLGRWTRGLVGHRFTTPSPGNSFFAPGGRRWIRVTCTSNCFRITGGRVRWSVSGRAGELCVALWFRPNRPRA